MITIVKQVSHMRGCLTLGRVSQPVQAGRAALAGWMAVTGEVGGSMAKWRHVTRKAAYCCPSFLFFSRAHTRKSQWVVTVTKYRSAIAAAAAHYIHTLLHTMLHIYSVLMLTKQEDSLLIIISRLRGSLIISRLSPRTKACFDWIDDSGSEQSESSINSDHARLVTAAAVITEFYARLVCVR